MFLIYVLVKKCIEMCIKLFKMFKCVFEPQPNRASLSFTHFSTTLHFCFFYYFIYIVGRILFFLGLRNSCYNLNACSKKKKKKPKPNVFMKFPSSLFWPTHTHTHTQNSQLHKHVCILGSTGLAWASFHDLGLNLL